jgi:sugar lactone lactonase YvrE
MKVKILLIATCCFLVAAVALGQGQRQTFPQAEGEKEVTVTEIPGVVAAGAKWTRAWQGTDNADGLVASPDGGLLFAQEQPSQIGKLDRNDKYSVFIKDTHGAGSVTIDTKGRIIAAQRTCTDPGRPANLGPCTEDPMLSVLAPERKLLANRFKGKPIDRPNDLVVDKKGNVYYTAGTAYYIKANGEVVSLGDDIRSNGIMLSPDDKILYVTNGNTILAFDVQPDGTVTNRRDFVKLPRGNGDGMAVDNAGRLYIATQAAGIQVFTPDAKYLGTIPVPRDVASIAFAGPDKKILYAQGRGALGPDGKEFKTPEGVRNNAKSIYRIQMLAQGYTGRPK